MANSTLTKTIPNKQLTSVLDNPVWHAMITQNGPLSLGNKNVKYFQEGISPFIGVSKFTKRNFELLFKAIPYKGSFAVASPKILPINAPWNLVEQIDVLQMVYTPNGSPVAEKGEIRALGTKDIPAMLELTALTNPGPFDRRTIEFGHYEGIFDGEHLVAMAGQRLHPAPYAEISAVCTHPDHTGHGFARVLMTRQISRILKAGEIPFLHVKTGNSPAIALYERLGFTKRRDMFVQVFEN